MGGLVWMPHAPPDCVVCVWVSVGVFAQISVPASFHVYAVKCRSECVVCVVHLAASSALFTVMQ